MKKMLPLGTDSFVFEKTFVRMEKKQFLLADLNNVQEELLYYPRRWRCRWRRLPQMLKFSLKVFKTSLFPTLITDLIHLWYDDTYWSKILRSTNPTTLGHVKVKVTDLEFSC